MNRRQTLGLLLAAASCSRAPKPVETVTIPRRATRRALPESAITTIRAEEGWYMHSAGVVATGGSNLCCTYRRSDAHRATMAEVWSTQSGDGGKTWTDHQMLTRLGWDPDRASWVCPQLGETADGRLLLLIDRGEKLNKADWPMLAQWQMPDRGMSNWLMESADKGRTWTKPRKVDSTGGEPSYIIEMSNGDLLYTRTDARPTAAKKFPAMPWGPNYYRSTAVISTDRGKSWNLTVPVADDPLVGDCEVGVVEYRQGGALLGITRIGDAGSALGQPSRFVRSSDYGRTWAKPELSPIYAHRACVKRLQNGRLMASFRNAWGTPGTCVFVFDPTEKFTYGPNSFLWDPQRCRIENDAMVLDTGEDAQQVAIFTLYPMEDDESSLDLEFELAVESAGRNACNVAAGAWIRFLPNRVEIAERPTEGFDIDATQFHRYRVMHERGRVSISVDGEEKLNIPDKDIFTRLVRFGCKGPRDGQTTGVSKWRSFRASVQNRRDHSVEWAWTPASGFPDQFQRDRVVCLEPNGSMSSGDSGYSGWDQMPDGSIVVVDYTTTKAGLSHPIMRSYRIDREMLPEAFG